MTAALILFYLILGSALRRLEILKEGAHETLTAIVIYVCLPALTVLNASKMELSIETLLPASAAWLLFGLSFATFWLFGRLCRWPRETVGALILTGGLANTSFVGYPLIEGWYGPKGISTAILVDQGGSFFMLCTFGMLTAAFFSGQSANVKSILAAMLRFPPFTTLLLSLFVLKHIPISSEIEAPLRQFLSKLASPLVPLSLISVGSQLKMDRSLLRGAWEKNRIPLSIGLGCKLVLIPAFICGVFLTEPIHRRMTQEAYEITVLEIAMAPMITGALLASRNRLNPDLAALMVSIGIPLSLLTTAIAHRLFS